MHIRLILSIAVVLSAAGSTWADAAALRPASARHEGKGHADVYLIRPDGSHRIRLTHAGEDIYYTWPAWSRDGTQVAFSGPVCADCRDGLFVAQSDGSRVTRLRLGKRPGYHPTSDPTGRRIAFVGGAGSLDILDLKTRAIRRVAGGRVASDQPAWSPDGRRVALTFQQQNGRWDIWTMDPAGRHRRRLTRTDVTEAQPAWSPDGRRIAFTRQVKGHWSLWTMRADGSDQRQITTGVYSDETPTWSPDGRRLAFARASVNGIYVIDLANGRTTRIRTGIENSSSPAWSPRGDTIAFIGQPAQD
jgi:TolB protein